MAKRLDRPTPPGDLVSIDGLVAAPDAFVPAPSLLQWIEENYLDEEGPLYWEGHAHLKNATIGCLWTAAEYKKRGKRVVGLAENPNQAKGTWSKARGLHQLREWFGTVPDFVLTFDAVYCEGAPDLAFCALVDHELAHCAQEEDEYGQPKFNKATGKPIWTMKSHDVEEFVSVVQRFGIEAAGREAVDLVLAAAGKPDIGRASVAGACGTCLRKVA